ncbi:RAD23 family protein [Nocardiopsis lucentensis]|uniref:hypothetical protein n=1 Tax=Nocardiopsis lucentensis TaxID=53441 RepID=UPI001268ED6A|nr:hypothetical protein [Nocardiopsis lucentensis]
MSLARTLAPRLATLVAVAVAASLLAVTPAEARTPATAPVATPDSAAPTATAPDIRPTVTPPLAAPAADESADALDGVDLSSPDVSVREVEILVTNDSEVLEVGEGGDVESVDAYLEETYEGSDLSTADVERLYLTHGVLRIITVACRSALVEYQKSSGSRITAKFQVQYSDLSVEPTSSLRAISAGQTSNHTFRLYRGLRVRGLMHVSFQGVFATPFAYCWT